MHYIDIVHFFGINILDGEWLESDLQLNIDLMGPISKFSVKFIAQGPIFLI